MLTTLRPVLWRRSAFALLWVMSLSAIVHSAIFVRRHLIASAWFDYWNWVSDYQRWVEGQYTFYDLIKPHNDTHRIATTRAILLLDSLFFDMTGWFSVITSFLLLLAIGWMVAKMATRDGVPALIPRLTWAGLACSTCQWDNLVFPFQVQFPITCVLGCGCAWLLSAAAGASKGRAVALGLAAGIAAILADFSMASGILLAPALLLLLAMRRARWQAWAAFTPLCGLGVALYEHHLPPVSGPRLLGWQLNWNRLLYSGDFLAADLNCFSEAWTWLIGLALLAALLAVGFLLLRRYNQQRAPMPSGDAALLAIGLWVAACGPAGSFTLRITYGPSAALVGRYATMSLLLAGVLLALAMRQAAWNGGRLAGRTALWLAAVGCLVVFNLPAYDTRAGALQHVIAADTELLVNDLAIDGPVLQTFLGITPAVRASAAFLHARQLNMFAPENEPSAAAVAQARAARPDTLAACRGWLDYGYALDGTGFLLRGWATDPSGKHNAAWVAAIGTEGLIGMARPLAQPWGMRVIPGVTAAPPTFESGFRFAGPTKLVEEGRPVVVMALFPGRPDLACKLPVVARIGPLRIGPSAAVPQNGLIAPGAVSLAGGFALLPDHAMKKASGGAAWQYDGSGAGMLRLSFPPGTGLGQDVAIPFATADEAPGRRMVVHFADGAQAAIDLPSPWRRPAWRAVDIPREMLARHGGMSAVEVRAAGAGELTVATPMLGDVDENWARLF